MGKNTMVGECPPLWLQQPTKRRTEVFLPQVRRALKGFISEFPEYERLLPHVKGTIKFLRLSDLPVAHKCRQCWIHIYQCRPQQDPR